VWLIHSHHGYYIPSLYQSITFYRLDLDLKFFGKYSIMKVYGRTKRGGDTSEYNCCTLPPSVDIRISCLISGVWKAQRYLRIPHNLCGGPSCDMPSCFLVWAASSSMDTNGRFFKTRDSGLFYWRYCFEVQWAVPGRCKAVLGSLCWNLL
jgi:hypothetical protein